MQQLRTGIGIPAPRFPVEAGKLYAVSEVAGHPPKDVRDFTGHASFSVVSNGTPQRIEGTGVMGSTSVLRFYETDSPGGPDDAATEAEQNQPPVTRRPVRVWDIAAVPGAGIVAYPLTD